MPVVGVGRGIVVRRGPPSDGKHGIQMIAWEWGIDFIDFSLTDLDASGYGNAKADAETEGGKARWNAITTHDGRQKRMRMGSAPWESLDVLLQHAPTHLSLESGFLASVSNQTISSQLSGSSSFSRVMYVSGLSPC